jgi:NhaP-type Na+/H+ or K+/H+ antiporter
LILQTIVLAVALGIGAQVLADRLKLPAILPLLVFGVLAGPNLWHLFGIEGGGLIDPALLGGGLEIFIHLGIGVILFEGGLSLNPQELRRVGGPVRNLLTLGVLITALVAAGLFRAVTAQPWSTAALFGAIVTVTGPTVIGPLLRHMIVPRRVATVLMSEGLIVDPIGAVLAYLVLQAIERPGMPVQPLAHELLVLVLVGTAFGVTAGLLGRWLARSRWTGGELSNLAILALLLVCFFFSEDLAPQSGILASMVMGFTMASANLPDLAPLKAFKGQLTVLLISVLFVLLAGQLDLHAVLDLGVGGLLVVGGLILVARPLAVFLSIPPGRLPLAERSVLALTAPRGVVAAGVGSLAARELHAAGIEGGAALEGMVYLTILATVVWATVMALVLPPALGYTRDPRRRLTLIVGAHALSGALARVLVSRGRTVVVIDSSPSKLAPLRGSGLGTFTGDARDAASFEAAGIQRDSQVVALTTNDELNLLVAELVRDEFDVEHPVVALQRLSEELGTVRRAWVDLLGGEALDVQAWIRRFEDGHARVVTLNLEPEQAVGDVLGTVEEMGAGVLQPVCGWRDGTALFRLADGRFEGIDALTLLVAGDRLPAVLEPYLEPEVDAVAEAERTAGEKG